MNIRERVSGDPTVIKPSNPIFPAPISSPPPREAEASAPQAHSREDLWTPPSAPIPPTHPNQVWGGREPLPTDNSHFFAARFRNTLGLMPSGELCNQGHRSLAKQTRLCVCSGGPGGAHGAGGWAPVGPRVRLVCSAEPRESGARR